jgi:hypothetical protein
MSRDWEEQFKQWARPPGKTEEDRCSNSVSAIQNAINASDKLSRRRVRVFTQGSYKNNTNVRQDSDVDIACVCTDTFFHDPLPEGWTAERLGLVDATYHYSEFKNDVQNALVAYFGSGAVSRGNKAIDVHETSYHVEADVAPFFEHRRYLDSGRYLEGVELRADDCTRVVIWPEQNYTNGCAKNTNTGRRYKSVVRVLKALSVEMADNGVISGDIPGFLIECLVWNVPNSRFQNYMINSDVAAALAFVFENTKDADGCSEWGEVSDLKYLFRGLKKWTRQQANDFTYAAWNYAELA